MLIRSRWFFKSTLLLCHFKKNQAARLTYKSRQNDKQFGKKIAGSETYISGFGQRWPRLLIRRKSLSE
jgi:hypothetical protein